MNLDEALEVLEGGEIKVYDGTPLGAKLSVTTPSGEDWHASGDELEAAKQVMSDYEDVATAVYEADSDEKIERIIDDAEVDDPCRVIARVENIPLTADECRRLAD